MSKTHVIDGVTYVEVERKADVGDYVTYVYNFRRDDVVREVQDFDDEGVSFEDNPYVDSDGIEISGLCHGAYVVLEPLETEAIPSVTDLLANLARRVSSLEQQLSSTQTNVEKLAEELANVKHLTESNEQDIAMLDERTRPTEEPVTPDESIPQYWAEALIRFYGGNR
jgi:archaellum component FlaC